MSTDEDLNATEQEDPKSWISDPKNLRKVLWCGVVLLLLLPVPTAYRVLKSWRASQLAKESNSAFILGDTAQGVSLLRSAMSLSPGAPAVLTSEKLFNMRIGDRGSTEGLLSRMRSGSSNKEELLGLASISVNAGDIITASEALAALPKDLSEQESLEMTLVESAIKMREGKANEGADLCITKAATMRGISASFLQNQASLCLLSLNEANARDRALGFLKSVTKERNAASLPAWRAMAATILSSPKEIDGVLPLKETLTFSRQPEFLKGASISDQLLAADLEIRSEPSRQDGVIKALTFKYSNADRPSMLAVARWLNVHGLYPLTIEFAGSQRPRSDSDWLLLVLDAKASAGHWDEVTPMLEYPSGSGIPDAVRSLFKARIASMRHDQISAEEEWKNVTSLLPLEKSKTMAYIAEYEERIGERDQEIRTLREMTNRKETQKDALMGLIRLEPTTAPASEMIPLYVELVACAPDLREAAGDLAYLRLLTGEEIEKSAKTSEQLLTFDPNSLARISAAAIARLKMGNPKGALQLYEGKSIDWSAAPQPWRAVYYAVLMATGDTSANSMRATINPEALRPEELALLNTEVRGDSR
jgi:hypothetical protein